MEQAICGARHKRISVGMRAPLFLVVCRHNQAVTWLLNAKVVSELPGLVFLEVTNPDLKIPNLERPRRDRLC